MGAVDRAQFPLAQSPAVQFCILSLISGNACAHAPAVSDVATTSPLVWTVLRDPSKWVDIDGEVKTRRTWSRARRCCACCALKIQQCANAAYH
jgi:hypothetical protein